MVEINSLDVAEDIISTDRQMEGKYEELRWCYQPNWISEGKEKGR
jgi:hypothetical protein